MDRNRDKLINPGESDGCGFIYYRRPAWVKASLIKVESHNREDLLIINLECFFRPIILNLKD